VEYVNEAGTQEVGPAARGDESGAEVAPDRPRRDEEPDLLLDVSELRVDEISLDVEDLRARVALQADVLELLKLHVGVEAELGRVQLTIKGVEAKVLLKVRLDNVARILDRVLTTIDNNPEIVERLAERLGTTAEQIGAGAGEAAGELGRGAASAVEDTGRAVEGVAEEIRPGRGDREPAERPPEARRRRTKAEAPRKRPAKGTRPRRSPEDS
jgi:hypothetical protein